MSDVLYAAYRNEKFQIMDYKCRIEEVDRPWVAETEMGPMFDLWRQREENIQKYWPKDPPRHGHSGAKKWTMVPKL